MLERNRLELAEKVRRNGEPEAWRKRLEEAGNGWSPVERQRRSGELLAEAEEARKALRTGERVLSRPINAFM